MKISDDRLREIVTDGESGEAAAIALELLAARALEPLLYAVVDAALGHSMLHGPRCPAGSPEKKPCDCGLVELDRALAALAMQDAKTRP